MRKEEFDIRDKVKIELIKLQLLRLTSDFCRQRLNEEYEELCKKMILKMSRKRQVPFLSGNPGTWAAGIIYALGQINFLFDKSKQPNTTRDELCNFFGVAKGTASQKAKRIREMFRLTYFDDEFFTEDVAARNPLMAMAEMLMTLRAHSLQTGALDRIVEGKKAGKGRNSGKRECIKSNSIIQKTIDHETPDEENSGTKKARRQTTLDDSF